MTQNLKRYFNKKSGVNTNSLDKIRAVQWGKARLMIALVLALSFSLTLSSCSLRDMKKWFDEMEWERSDRVVKLSHHLQFDKQFNWRITR